jgi:3-deoxy-manno-octulosonate cytidylyltransferase (CMP-KDO synthetase)
VAHFLGIIPARYASSRFPGKPLALLGKKPMIQWVFERASAVLDQLVVATDDLRIKEAVESFGGNVLMTSAEHSTGTERCAEALELFRKGHSGSITHVVNIQGDEPLLEPVHLEALKSCMLDRATQIATLIQPLAQNDDLANPNLVKVVVDKSFRALYFSRSPIPFFRESSSGEPSGTITYFTHIGLYAFRSDVLSQLVRLPVSSLERAESLEQLRWLENGYSIQTRVTDQPSRGVDTPEDLEKISRLI